MKKLLFLSCVVVLFAACLTGGGSRELAEFEPFEAYVSPQAPARAQSFRDISASQLVSEIKLGWNLGNTLDAAGLFWLSEDAEVYSFETAWGNPETTKANFDALKNAGFNAVRIPVSWTKMADENFILRQDWMDRVTEVVNYAAVNDMYILLNTHHDEDVFKFTRSKRVNSITAFRIIWWQIANNFKNYNEKLIFEALNEPRTKGSEAEWMGGTSSEHAVLNEYYRHFVDVVRASGGNNEKRMLMVNTYAASAALIAVVGLKIPEDTIENKIIVSVHAYSPNNFALNTNNAFNTWSVSNSSDTSSITSMMTRINSAFVSKGIPVIIGEFGAMNKDNESARASWARFYTENARAIGVPCFWWDNGLFEGSGERFGLLDRDTNRIVFPQIMEGLKQGAGVR